MLYSIFIPLQIHQKEDRENIGKDQGFYFHRVRILAPRFALAPVRIRITYSPRFL